MADPSQMGENLVSEIDGLIKYLDDFQPVAVAGAQSQKRTTTDIAWQPLIPPGHTPFSWNGEISECVKPVTKPPAQKKPVQKPPQKAQTQAKAKTAPPKKQPKKQQQQKKQPKKSQAKSNNSHKPVVKGTERRDTLLGIENRIQKLWDDNKAFESNPSQNPEKYYMTFPYPYMNGWLHLGHAFSLTKCEFTAGYQRLKGKNVLFPFSFHCTGMPIAAAALKIQKEMEQFGNPPKFPVEKEDEGTGKQQKKKGKKKKGKAAKKKSKKKYQWQILQEFGLSDDEIASFADPMTWLNHFPTLGMEHLKRFGLKGDWRRSFITTNVNPYYDAFITWQFKTLEKNGKLWFGNRPSVFSTVTMQPCADHDRAQGEQVNPQNYTLIKMRVLPGETPYTQKYGDKLAEILAGDKPVFMVAGTLRPETMYGQTNCFVLPNGDYIVVETKDGELWITGKDAAMNMSWQEMLANPPGEIVVLQKLWGKDLLGRKVQAPLAKYEYVHVLPLMTIKMDKATGVVTSVPSDAPDDYAALNDMKKDKKMREKHFITAEMVENFDVVEIIDIPPTDDHPQLGRQSAVSLCKAMKVKSQKDAAKLEIIKDVCYKNGFSKGTMLVGEFAGEAVKTAKDKVKEMMISQGMAANYWEPEDVVIARTGDKCVVAFSDQWFLKYGEDEWRQKVQEQVDRMEFYSPRTRQEFNKIVDWLKMWACSREFGLGTQLPCGPQFVIESLSDSTIYMAYYTIAHIIQGDCDFVGANSNIKPEWLTMEVFDYVFLGKAMPDSPIGKDRLERMRREFMYWYPMDLRTSGKDLIGNHLTMTLYNHSGIWEDNPELWPRSYFCNGHVQINGEKMSKSTGNFLTIVDAIDKFSADGTRFALADSGDGLEDSNFSEAVANSAILNLTKEEIWETEQMDNMDFLRTGDYTTLDHMFDNAISACIQETDKAYSEMQFKHALRMGWYALQKARDFWRNNCDGLHRDLVQRFITTQITLLAPICPHWSEHMWQKCKERGFPVEGFVVNAPWPTGFEVDYTLQMQFEFIQEARHKFQQEWSKQDTARIKSNTRKKENKPAHNSCRILVAAEYLDYQIYVLNTLQGLYDPSENTCDTSYRKIFKSSGHPIKKVMDFATMIVKNELPERREEALSTQTPFNELDTIKEYLGFVIGDVPLSPDQISIYAVTDPNKDDPKNLSEKTIPRQPSIQFFLREENAI